MRVKVKTLKLVFSEDVSCMYAFPDDIKIITLISSIWPCVSNLRLLGRKSSLHIKKGKYNELRM